MTEDEFKALNSYEDDAPPPPVRASELENQEDRLLLRGYDHNRLTFEVHLEDGMFVIWQKSDRDIGTFRDDAKTSEAPVELLYPKKRVYWEYTDFEFAVLLKKHKADVTYTSRN